MFTRLHSINVRFIGKWIKLLLKRAAPPARLRRAITSLNITAVMVIIPVAATIVSGLPAAASTAVGGNDYPWSGATDCSGTYGMYSWCINGSDLSPLKFGYRNCTDYAAYEINEQMGSNTSNNVKFSWSKFGFTGNEGNAVDWENQSSITYGQQSVNGTPAVGSVAWWGAEVAGGFGHVAIVASVNYNSDGSVKSIGIDDYNSGYPLDNKGNPTWGNYDSRTIQKSASDWPDDFLHIADINSSPPPVPPLRIGTLTTSGTFLVKEGGLSTPWTKEYSGVQAGYLSGDRIGILTNNGTFLVKQGGLSTPWVNEYVGASQGALSGNLIGVLTTSGDFLVKQGGLSTPWVNEYVGAANGSLSEATSTTSLRIGILTANNSFLVKQGTLYAPWVNEHENITQGMLSGNLIGVQTISGDYLVKQGDLNDQWVTEYSGVNEGLLWSGQ